MLRKQPTPRVVQCFCSLNHCILVLAYLPGLTAAQESLGGTGDVTLTQENASEYLRSFLDEMIELKTMNPWCGLCKSPRERWKFVDNLSKYEKMDITLHMLEQEQIEIAASFRHLQRIPNGTEDKHS